MKLTEAIDRYDHDDAVRKLKAAKEACYQAGCHDEEFTILQKLVARLKELSGKPIAVGV